MTPELKKVIAERVEILPRALREKLSDPVSLREQIVSLGQKCNLTVEQTAVMEDEVMLTLLAFAPYTELPENIARELGVEEHAVLPLVGNILSEIFTPEILRELDQIANSQTDKRVPTPPPAPPQEAPQPPPVPVSAYAPPPQTPAPQAPPPPAYVPVPDQPVPAPPAISQYQKPLTSVPQYRNADLYKKPPQ